MTERQMNSILSIDQILIKKWIKCDMTGGERKSSWRGEEKNEQCQVTTGRGSR